VNSNVHPLALLDIAPHMQRHSLIFIAEEVDAIERPTHYF
jgi:hypothetical protein